MGVKVYHLSIANTCETFPTINGSVGVVSQFPVILSRVGLVRNCQVQLGILLHIMIYKYRKKYHI